VSGARSAPPGQSTVPVSGSTVTFGETLRRTGVLKYGPTHSVEQVDLATQPICEREVKDAMPNDDGISYVGRQTNHRSGAIA
jgi:hypothetical protein